jgi:hypothetical protein
MTLNPEVTIEFEKKPSTSHITRLLSPEVETITVDSG